MKEMYPLPLPFESSYLPRVRRRPMKQPIKVRIMLPMSIRCNTCWNHICQGTEFNPRKEKVVGETYLGNQTFRFYFQCTECSAELAIKTQPQAPDCVVESGATRVVEVEKRRREAADETSDVMKPLLNSTPIFSIAIYRPTSYMTKTRTRMNTNPRTLTQ
ncbi:hypothetical protein ACJRO7_030635, partial [Eucalyptus globulus]